MRLACRIVCSLALAVSLALPLALPLVAPASAATDVSVTDVWARATPAAAKMGAIYLTLESPAGDRLVGASVPRAVAAHTQIHETVVVPDSGGGNAGGRMTMRQVAAIALPAGEAVRLAPGGYHVMLLDLKKPLRAGARVPLTLLFEKAGKRTVVETVRDE